MEQPNFITEPNGSVLADGVLGAGRSFVDLRADVVNEQDEFMAGSGSEQKGREDGKIARVSGNKKLKQIQE